MTTSELSGYSDEDLLIFLNTVREQRGRIEAEVQRRFQAGNTTVIETEHWRAVQRQDAVKYVFSERDLQKYYTCVGDWGTLKDAKELEAEAREISRPYISLTKKETTTETPL